MIHDRVRAVETMLRNLDIRERIWIKRGEIIRAKDLGYLSGGARILVDAALNIWNGSLAKVDLEGVIGNLDDQNFDAFMDAVLIARGRKSENDEPSRYWYQRLALASTLQPDLNANEHAVLISCAASSEANGHDFGIMETVIGTDANFYPHGLAVNQIKGYLSQLQSKGYIEIHEPQKVNGEYWVTQFILTDKGRKVFLLDA